MLLAERQLFVRFLRRAGVILLITSGLVVVLFMRRLLGLDPDRMDARVLLGEFFRFEGLAITFAAPLGALMLMMELKSSGILAGLLAGGLGPARIRRVFLYGALVTVVLTGLAEEAGWHPGARPNRAPDAWRSGDVIAWSPRGGESLTVWREDSLDVWSYDRVERNEAGEFVLGPARSHLGTPLEARTLAPPRRRGTILAPPPLSVWLRGDAPFAACLGGLSRILVAGLLVLGCAYLGLLVPVQQQWAAMIAFLFVIVIGWIFAVWLAVLVWKGGWHAYAAMAGTWALALLVLAYLHRLYDRRGLRVA